MKKQLLVLFLAPVFILSSCASDDKVEPQAFPEASNLSMHLESAFRRAETIEQFTLGSEEDMNLILDSALLTFNSENLEIEPTEIQQFDEAGFLLPVLTAYNDSVRYCILPSVDFAKSLSGQYTNRGKILFMPVLGGCDSQSSQTLIEETLNGLLEVQKDYVYPSVNSPGLTVRQMLKSLPANVDEAVVYVSGSEVSVEYADESSDLGFSINLANQTVPLPYEVEQVDVGYVNRASGNLCIQYKFFDKYIHVKNGLVTMNTTYIKDECGTLAY